MNVAASALALIDAAEATVMVRDPADASKVIVGFRIDPEKRPMASMVGAFNLMVDLAESAAGRALPIPRETQA